MHLDIYPARKARSTMQSSSPSLAIASCVRARRPKKCGGRAGRALIRLYSHFHDSLRYYYGALSPNEHYVSFWTSSSTDVLDVLENLSRPEADAPARSVAKAGQAFAHQHLEPHARQCYWRALLKLYTRRLRHPPKLGDWPDAIPSNLRPCRGPDPRLNRASADSEVQPRGVRSF